MLFMNIYRRIISYSSSSFLQAILDQFVDRSGVSYACLSSDEVIVAASKNWWSLDPEEIVLLNIFTHSIVDSFVEKIIFLPKCNPMVRLLNERKID